MPYLALNSLRRQKAMTCQGGVQFCVGGSRELFLPAISMEQHGRRTQDATVPGPDPVVGQAVFLHADVTMLHAEVLQVFTCPRSVPASVSTVNPDVSLQ